MGLNIFTLSIQGSEARLERMSGAATKPGGAGTKTSSYYDSKDCIYVSGRCYDLTMLNSQEWLWWVT
ncbi:hypothetical protein F8388_024745 [Cannabis sativa]|uniref:Uncharacterized protein n=1 Tax=Cannabis sativa TaxID=3483 RepID=A0A7J6GC98_CANSA|nr:hypothetical protein F8388_024745 [Cannabis sativa]